MPYTLLEVVNAYMDATGNFQVATIGDINESVQVANFAKRVFRETINDTFETSLSEDLIQLDSLADSTKPNYLKLPTTANKIYSRDTTTIMYNKASDTGSTLKLEPVIYMEPQEFLDYVGQRSTNENNTQIVIDFSGYQMVVKNTTAPQYFTSFDDEYLVFDSYDSTVDSTLQSSKSGAIVSQQKTFLVEDGYEIDLPEWYQEIYLSDVINRASIYLREEPQIADARIARLGKIKARKKSRIGNNKIKKGYGR